MGLEFQDILLMGMGFHNKLCLENGISPPPPKYSLKYSNKLNWEDGCVSLWVKFLSTGRPKTLVQDCICKFIVNWFSIKLEKRRTSTSGRNFLLFTESPFVCRGGFRAGGWIGWLPTPHPSIELLLLFRLEQLSLNVKL